MNDATSHAYLVRKISALVRARELADLQLENMIYLQMMVASIRPRNLTSDSWRMSNKYPGQFPTKNTVWPLTRWIAAMPRFVEMGLTVDEYGTPKLDAGKLPSILRKAMDRYSKDYTNSLIWGMVLFGSYQPVLPIGTAERYSGHRWKTDKRVYLVRMDREADRARMRFETAATEVSIYQGKLERLGKAR